SGRMPSSSSPTRGRWPTAPPAGPPRRPLPPRHLPLPQCPTASTRAPTTSTTMRSEQLLPPPQPAEPWSVALEGAARRRVSESVVASLALYGGMELEAETLTALQEAAALAAWREKAGRLLTARMLSSGQLAEKLTAKGATEEQ